MYQKNRTEVIYEAVRNERIEKLPDGGLPSAASGASSSSSNLATVNVISIFGGHLQNKRGIETLFIIFCIRFFIVFKRNQVENTTTIGSVIQLFLIYI